MEKWTSDYSAERLQRKDFKRLWLLLFFFLPLKFQAALIFIYEKNQASVNYEFGL